jgi:hypothetical protein
MIPYLERCIARVEGLVAGDAAERERKKAGDELAEVKEVMEVLDTFYRDVLTCWASPDKRVLGHVIYSPPIELGFGTEQCKPNVFTQMMYPNLRSAHTFEYPEDHLLRLKGYHPGPGDASPSRIDLSSQILTSSL